jgi:hypothetical protein
MQANSRCRRRRPTINKMVGSEWGILLSKTSSQYYQEVSPIGIWEASCSGLCTLKLTACSLVMLLSAYEDE